MNYNQNQSTPIKTSKEATKLLCTTAEAVVAFNNYGRGGYFSPKVDKDTEIEPTIEHLIGRLKNPVDGHSWFFWRSHPGFKVIQNSKHENCGVPGDKNRNAGFFGAERARRDLDQGQLWPATAHELHICDWIYNDPKHSVKKTLIHESIHACQECLRSTIVLADDPLRKRLIDDWSKDRQTQFDWGEMTLNADTKAIAQQFAFAQNMTSDEFLRRLDPRHTTLVEQEAWSREEIESIGSTIDLVKQYCGEERSTDRFPPYSFATIMPPVDEINIELLEDPTPSSGASGNGIGNLIGNLITSFFGTVLLGAYMNGGALARQ